MRLVPEFLEHSAARLPDKVALVSQKRRVTYREIDERANRLAHHLRAAGVSRGDRVALYADNGVDLVVALWSALKADGVFIVVNPLTRAEKLGYILRDSGATALVTEALHAREWRAAVAQAPALRAVVVTGAVRPELLEGVPGAASLEAAEAAQPSTRPFRRSLAVDLACVIYTSGSTGEPKGVMLTHQNMEFASWSITTLLSNTEDDVILGAIPLAFNYGLYQLLMAFRLGARLVLERSFAFPVQVLRLMAEEGVTGFPGVPTMYAMLAELKNVTLPDLSSVRYITNTAAALQPGHIEALERLFPRAGIWSMYGLTECKRCSYLPAQDLHRKPGSVGFAIPGTELWIVDEHGQRAAPGVVGELVVRGPHIMKGYLNKPELTARFLRPGPLPNELVFYTGDYCRVDEEGYLYFVSRMDEVIKSRGEKVPPAEVEAALARIEGVKEVAVIGVADPILGQAIKAFLVMNDDAKGRYTEKDITTRVSAFLESYMVPKFVVFLDEFPKTAMGKTLKKELK
ncbi:MAG: acyl--CoA ligase [Deltaproteobacteria bacterium]|nr:acyl--CoA ligase [Deltaproteobacteria bacterium]